MFLLLIYTFLYIFYQKKNMTYIWCTCIIPFYNEKDGVINVIKKLADIQQFNEIILVNDWSKDNSLALVENFIDSNKYTHIKCISYTENKGKSHAIHQGVKATKTEYVFMFDSDIKEIKTEEIVYTIKHMYKYPKIDMGILRRTRAKWYIKILYRELILSGQRMLRTKDLEEIFTQSVEKYQLEVAINTFMEKRKKTVVRYPFSGENSCKSEKRGIINGRKRDLFMFKDIFKYQGILGYIKHSFFFSPINEKKYK